MPLYITATTTYRPLCSVVPTFGYARRNCYFDPWLGIISKDNFTYVALLCYLSIMC